jgi:hypothetical protein
MNGENAGTKAAISLPKGGGAIKGIGETFQPNLFTGTGNGNGPFGLGWQLSIPRVTRKTEKGLPTYTNDDVFVLSGAEAMVPVSDAQGPPSNPVYIITRYRPRTEGAFVRLYGNTPENLDVSRKAGPERMASHPLDPSREQRRHYLFEVLFDYSDPPDPLPVYDASPPDTPWWDRRHDDLSAMALRPAPFSTFRKGENHGTRLGIPYDNDICWGEYYYCSACWSIRP